MRFICLFLVLVSFASSAQNQPIAVTIVSVLADDSDPSERKFTIHYNLTNLTGKKLSFFQKPEDLISNVGGSMSNCPYYKIYQGDQFLNLGTVFGRPPKGETYQTLKADFKTPEKQLEIVKLLRDQFGMNDSLIEVYKRTGEIVGPLQYKERNLMEELVTLDSNEVKPFSKVVYWDKDRYFFHDPEEFYLSETAKHYIEITMLLMKEPFKDKLSEEEYASIMADENFIKGVFVSNRVEINFN